MQPKFWPCPRLSMSSRPPTCHGAGAAMGPTGTTILWDVLVPGDAGIVDTVHISPVPVLGEICWGQVFMRPRIGPRKRSWQWKPILEYIGPPLPQPGPQISHSSCGPLPFPKMWTFQSLTKKRYQQNPELLEADCDRSPKYPSAHQQRQQRRELPKPTNPKAPRDVKRM